MGIEYGVKGLVDKGGFTAARYTCYAYHHPERELYCNVLEVIARTAFEHYALAIAFAAFAWGYRLAFADVIRSGGIGLE